MSGELYFEVAGVPATKGSWRPVRRRGKTRMVPQIKREPKWAESVRVACGGAMYAGDVSYFTGAVEVALLFRFVKPKRAKRPYPSKGDIDKLSRSVLDALNGVAWVDDVQVVRLDATKAYWADPGVSVRIKSTGGTR